MPAALGRQPSRAPQPLSAGASSRRRRQGSHLRGQRLGAARAVRPTADCAGRRGHRRRRREFETAGASGARDWQGSCAAGADLPPRRGCLVVAGGAETCDYSDLNSLAVGFFVTVQRLRFLYLVGLNDSALRDNFEAAFHESRVFVD